MDLDETELLIHDFRDREDDDELHQPSASDVERGHGRGTVFTCRGKPASFWAQLEMLISIIAGAANLGFLLLLLTGLVFLL